MRMGGVFIGGAGGVKHIIIREQELVRIVIKPRSKLK